MDLLDDWLKMFSQPKYRLVRSEMTGHWGFRLDDGAAIAFHLIRRGGAWLRRDGQADVLLEEGDLVILSGGTPHELVDEPETKAEPVECFGKRKFDLADCFERTEIFCGQFQPDVVRGQFGSAALPPFVHLKSHEVAGDAGITGLTTLLTSELDSERPGTELLMERLADSLLVYVLRSAAAQAGHGTGWLSAMQDAQLARVFRAIHASPERDWTVDTMAQEAGLSRAAFARRFNKRVGEPPLGYLTAWRMTLAASRLGAGKVPLQLVAAEIGYQSEAAFSRAFRKHFGVPPGAYRKTGGIGH
ncbi:transcriptional regulator, AraC family (plasmid) [Rhizobium leguminosarum bv. trifolii WSM2304]|uniref:Transcriptional regulator, AraC family n=1 Tax=Rhizobium leguminosarum bv. trifolii (strain WSM2304) TaxID=395492 RepID=A0ABF7QZN6_RHILW|nr:AraC family transcriptional regulator [Rhizobium leguminosarum]ACI59713.1 transcriptional regulator, AraC family [Rhizobium leguminosarum bv. trifolii WSM2304]